MSDVRSAYFAGQKLLNPSSIFRSSNRRYSSLSRNMFVKTLNFIKDVRVQWRVYQSVSGPLDLEVG